MRKSINIDWAKQTFQFLEELTLFRRRKLEMMRPSFIAFHYERDIPKVSFRALLYATGRHGYVVENMFIRLRRGELTQTFNDWAHVEYGETTARPAGSAIQVSEEGMVYTHHFLSPKAEGNFRFLPGDYLIEVYANLVQQRQPLLLTSVKLSLLPEHSAAMEDQRTGVFYNWSPDLENYNAHIEIEPAANAMRPLKSEESPAVLP